MVPLSATLSPSDADLGTESNDAGDRVPKVVEDARVEMERLIESLADGEYPIEMGSLASEDLEPVAEGRRAGDAIPVYLMISSKRALTRQYGSAGFEQLASDLRDLKQVVQARAGLETVIAYVDDEVSLQRFDLQPVDPAHPWHVKKLVDSIDAQLADRGRQIRYLLIVGGDRIIPFHRLPNPVDDQDSDVPSDNPYASRDANYLIPERAIGRLPDGENQGLALLRTLIRTSLEAHRRTTVAKGLLSTLSAALKGIQGGHPNGRGLGYSASIWRKASRAVFHAIGDDGRLRTCPPLTYEGFQVVEPPHFSYFNLHGIEDGPNWYGQRDALFPADYPLFPLALRPQDPSISEHADAVVFTEACYGANILGKSASDSIALRLLAVGALAVVGSTKISYGSIAPPLLGADLMGKHFWEGLRAHLTVGEALRHAKVSMASEMQRQQGYLDDEDQKALTSFVLYGDPSLPITSIRRSEAMGASADVFCPPIICSRKVEPQKGVTVRPASDELVARVKARIETSLPHMSHARVKARPLSVCSAVCDADCDVREADLRGSLYAPLEQKGLSRVARGWALTLHKDISVKGGRGDAGDALTRAHHQVVRVVVDEHGHILKMALSK